VPWWASRREELLAAVAHGSPRYLLAIDEVRRAARSLRTAMPAVDRWFYAMKANAHPAALAAIAEEGFGIECVSAAELDAVRAVLPGQGSERLLFTPNFAPRVEYERALALGVRVTLDSLHPLQHWPQLLRGQEVLLRLDPGHGAGHHDKVVTGGAGSKFGLALADCAEFRRLARDVGLRVTGIHAHLGSGILEAGHFGETYAELASLAEQFPDCTRINIGGGLGVAARADEQPLDLDAVGQALARVKALYPQFRLWMEPGRFLVADAGVLLATVTQVKQKDEYFYVGVDTGMNSLIRPALYEAWHEIVNLSRLGESADTVCEVVGPICESGDVLGNHRRLPRPREGDVLLIAQTGAYGSVMSSRYNLREPAVEVVL
jgi:diaminopimelate decarboxylase/aspartate kinase